MGCVEDDEEPRVKPLPENNSVFFSFGDELEADKVGVESLLFKGTTLFSVANIDLIV